MKDKSIFERFRKNKRLILLITLLSVISSLVVSHQFAEPVYQASAHILIGGERTDIETMDKYTIMDEMRFLDTYREIIKSPAVLSKARKLAGTDLSMHEVRENLLIEFKDNSQVFSISIKDENYAAAVQLANTIAEVFVEEAGHVMNANNITILDKAEVEEAGLIVSNGPELNLALALLSGLGAAFGLAFIIPELSTSIHTSDDAEELLAIPVIGIVSPIRANQSAKGTPFFQQRKLRQTR